MPARASEAERIIEGAVGKYNYGNWVYDRLKAMTG